MLKNDIRLLFREGIIPLYFLITIIYLIIISAIPLAWKDVVTRILIFSDPTTLGLYFMGAIVLTEKSQRVESAFSILPITTTKYALSKLLSLLLPSLVSASVLAYYARILSINLIVGMVLAYFIFTLLSIIISSFVSEINTYIMLTIPVMLLVAIPVFLHLTKIVNASIFPPLIALEMIFDIKPQIRDLTLCFTSIGTLFILSLYCIRRSWIKNRGANI